ncbi:MAG TPA: hypothetical protein VFB45_13810 [Pseudolabrys sp.]|nr:hypothetical protein [Pseudolabrys sp.]
MRKLIVFFLASAMLFGGLYVLATELLSGIFFDFLFLGAVFAALGGYLLWVDFAAPALGIKTWES